MSPGPGTALVLGFLNNFIVIIAMIAVSIATKKELVFWQDELIGSLLKARDNTSWILSWCGKELWSSGDIQSCGILLDEIDIHQEIDVNHFLCDLLRFIP